MGIDSIASQAQSPAMATNTQVSEKAREAQTPNTAKADTEKDSAPTDARRFDTFVKSGEEATPKEDAKKPTVMKCTVNTDKVDTEIKKLQQKKQEIQRQLQSAENAEKRGKLEQELQSLEGQLQAKDNDAYRKQHATYTYG